MSIQPTNFSRLSSDLLGEIGSFIEDKSIAPFWCTSKVFNATSVSNATLKGRNELMFEMLQKHNFNWEKLPAKFLTPQVKNSMTCIRSVHIDRQEMISPFEHEFVLAHELSLSYKHCPNFQFLEKCQNLRRLNITDTNIGDDALPAIIAVNNSRLKPKAL